MEIVSLKLRNYRNHRSLYQEFDSGLNVIVGANGVGKSNIIEAIALLATTRSFRTSDYRNIIEHNREFAAVEGDCDNKKLRIVISKMGRRFQCDQNPIKTSSDFIGLFQAVVFTPEDLNFVTSSPKFRRRLIDSELSKVNKKYLRNLSEFSTILKNRNALLKQEKFDENLLEVTDDRMAELMAAISAERNNYLKDINELYSLKLNELMSQPRSVKLENKSTCNGLSKEEIIQQLKSYRLRDTITKQSNFGIQRDDYQILYAGYNAAAYCSQGQIRLLMIALKLVLANLVKQLTNATPLILLDDVLSELDLQHQRNLLHQIYQKNQTIITATHLDKTLDDLDKKVIELRRT